MKWISVNDKLPSDLEITIVAFDDGAVNTDRYDYDLERWSRHRYDARKITHWMPLPKPPKQIK